MRKLIATIMLTSIMFNNSIANDDNNNNLSIGGKYYTSKGISVKNLSIPNETFLKYSGRGGYSAKNEGCSAVSRLYSQLGLSMDLDAVKNLFNNWKSLALPVSLYALATQFPYVKEVLVSSQYASDFLAKLGGTNCDSAFNFVNKVNGVSPSAVSSCMKHWSSVCDKSGDPNKCYLEHCGIHKSFYELISGKKFASMLSDPSAKKKVETALAMINPKTTISCALGLPALPENMSSTQFQQSARNISAGKGIPLVASRTLL
ncbi:MAG: hypothetical protein GWP10_06750, partial [Nitrospiraceae bacterium]|nr:hypothetical protein [Nitrospiraceae bacterium]